MVLSNEKQLYYEEKIKGFFFDLLTSKKSTENFSSLVGELISGLKLLLGAQSVQLYSYNKWKEQFLFEQSTEMDRTNTKLYTIEYNDFMRLDQEHDFASRKYTEAKLIWKEETEALSYIVFINNAKLPPNIIGWYEVQLCEIDSKDIELLHEIFELVSEQSSKFFEVWKRFFGSMDEDARYEQLYRVTSKFHSSMDMDDVLGEVINTLKEVYPSFEYYLLLSHDNSNHRDLPIKDLHYGSDESSQAATHAYLTGEVQFEDSLVDGRSVLYAPLKGKQGVYGVLQVTASNALLFPQQEVEFIELLANTAGSALENAQLYQQSKRLISDLQLINKTTHRLNSNLRLSETIKYMSEQITKSFKAEEVGFIIFTPISDYEILPGSTTYFTTELAKGFLNSINEKIKQEEDALFVGDLTSDTTIKKDHYRSLMAVPMIHSGKLKGAVFVLHHKPYYFSFENFKLLQSLIHHSTLAFTNSILREELEKLVITDHLTKLYSRNYLDERIHTSMEVDTDGTFLLIDIDNFKSVNDTFGHQVGDEVIIQVANIIKENIREFDIGARWGGEELAVYLPKATLEAGVKVAQRLVKAVEMKTEPKITISCGVAHWSEDKKGSVKKLFNMADEALYKAKEMGKNRVIISEDEEKRHKE